VEINLRKVIDLQMEFWKKDIASIEFDLESRDELRVFNAFFVINPER